MKFSVCWKNSHDSLSEVLTKDLAKSCNTYLFGLNNTSNCTYLKWFWFQLLLFTIIFLACSSCIHSVSFHLPITLQQKLSFHNSISTQNSTEWSSQSPSPSVRGETKVRGTAWGKASTGHPVINPKAKRTTGKERENGMQLLL